MATLPLLSKATTEVGVLLDYCSAHPLPPLQQFLRAEVSRPEGGLKAQWVK